MIAAGNSGYNSSTGQPNEYTTDQTPTKLVNAGSPVIVVGSTYHDGSLDEFSTPAKGDAEISMYAQGRYVATCKANTEMSVEWQDGTSVAAPQVVRSCPPPPSNGPYEINLRPLFKAGLAAYMLSYPWPTGQNPFDKNVKEPTVGRRMKVMLADVYAYQRLPRDRLENQAIRFIQRNNPTHSFPYPMPAKVNVAYNMAYGDQKCKAVDNFPDGIKARNFFAQYAESCAIPDTPGSGGGGDGMTTGSVFYTDGPTYMSDTWTGFSTANGSVDTPIDTGFDVPCVTTGCPPSSISSGTIANMTTAFSTPTLTTTKSTSFAPRITATNSNTTSSSVENTTTVVTLFTTTTILAPTITTVVVTATPETTRTEQPAPTSWNNGVVISYAKACQTFGDGGTACKIVWLFFNWNREGGHCCECENACDAADAPGTYDLKFDPPVYPNYTTMNVANVSGETGCWYNGTNNNWGGLFGCSGFHLPMRCEKFSSDGVQDVRNMTCDGGLLGSTWWTWSILDEFYCEWEQSAGRLTL